MDEEVASFQQQLALAIECSEQQEEEAARLALDKQHLEHDKQHLEHRLRALLQQLQEQGAAMLTLQDRVDVLEAQLREERFANELKLKDKDDLLQTFRRVYASRSPTAASSAPLTAASAAASSWSAVSSSSSSASGGLSPSLLDLQRKLIVSKLDTEEALAARDAASAALARAQREAAQDQENLNAIADALDPLCLALNQALDTLSASLPACIQQQHLRHLQRLQHHTRHAEAQPPPPPPHPSTNPHAAQLALAALDALQVCCLSLSA